MEMYKVSVTMAGGPTVALRRPTIEPNSHFILSKPNIGRFSFQHQGDVASCFTLSSETEIIKYKILVI